MIQSSVLDTRARMSDEIHRALHEGVPEVGWRGDPELIATHSNVHGWELWTPAPEGGHELVARQKIPNAPFDVTELCRHLAARDTHNRGVSHHQVIDEYLARVDSIQEAKERKLVEDLYEPTARATAAFVRETTGSAVKHFW